MSAFSPVFTVYKKLSFDWNFLGKRAADRIKILKNVDKILEVVSKIIAEEVADKLEKIDEPISKYGQELCQETVKERVNQMLKTYNELTEKSGNSSQIPMPFFEQN